jgi:hypothetical protein
VEETLVAGASVSVVARRHDVNANQVFAWRRQYRGGELGGGKAVAALVPVGVIGAGGIISAISDCVKPKASRSSTFLDLTSAPHAGSRHEPPPKTAPPKRPKMIEVELRSGTRIRIDVDVKASTLRQVLKLIRSLA